MHDSYQEMTDAFLCVKEIPFQGIEIDFEVFKIIERFTIVMYDKSSTEENVNDAREESSTIHSGCFIATH